MVAVLCLGKLPKEGIWGLELTTLDTFVFAIFGRVARS